LGLLLSQEVEIMLVILNDSQLKVFKGKSIGKIVAITLKAL
jgi:hypothetical protein